MVEGVHLLLFSSVDEFVELVVNHTQRAEYEPRRLAMVRNARVLAKNHTWRRQAQVLEGVLDQVVRAAPSRAPSSRV
jgi:hypothetical protein